jgi:hypothetical protein
MEISIDRLCKQESGLLSCEASDLRFTCWPYEIVVNHGHSKEVFHLKKEDRDDEGELQGRRYQSCRNSWLLVIND